MNRFASGPKRHYYGKGDVIAYRLNRDGKAPAGGVPVFGANVLLLLYGDAFWKTYTEGDNSGLIATDSMKNFIQRETMNFTGTIWRSTAGFSARCFSRSTRKSRGCRSRRPRFRTRLSAGTWRSCRQGRTWRRHASKSIAPASSKPCRACAASSCCASAAARFEGFVRDEYTTLPDLHNRPLHMWLDLEWSYADP